MAAQNEREVKVDLVSRDQGGEMLLHGELEGYAGSIVLRLTPESWKRIVEAVEWQARQQPEAA